MGDITADDLRRMIAGIDRLKAELARERARADANEKERDELRNRVFELEHGLGVAKARAWSEHCAGLLSRLNKLIDTEGRYLGYDLLKHEVERVLRFYPEVAAAWTAGIGIGGTWPETSGWYLVRFEHPHNTNEIPEVLQFIQLEGFFEHDMVKASPSYWHPMPPTAIPSEV